jgi:hypothetical protein
MHCGKAHAITSKYAQSHVACKAAIVYIVVISEVYHLLVLYCIVLICLLSVLAVDCQHLHHAMSFFVANSAHYSPIIQTHDDTDSTMTV